MQRVADTAALLLRLLRERQVSLRLRPHDRDQRPSRFTPAQDLSPVLRLLLMQSRIVLHVSLCNGYQTVTIIETLYPEITSLQQLAQKPFVLGQISI